MLKSSGEHVRWWIKGELKVKTNCWLNISREGIDLDWFEAGNHGKIITGCGK